MGRFPRLKPKRCGTKWAGIGVNEAIRAKLIADLPMALLARFAGRAFAYLVVFD
jgi:hypothetical protein